MIVLPARYSVNSYEAFSRITAKLIAYEVLYNTKCSVKGYQFIEDDDLFFYECLPDWYKGPGFYDENNTNIFDIGARVFIITGKRQ